MTNQWITLGCPSLVSPQLGTDPPHFDVLPLHHHQKNPRCDRHHWTKVDWRPTGGKLQTVRFQGKAGCWWLPSGWTGSPRQAGAWLRRRVEPCPLNLYWSWIVWRTMNWISERVNLKDIPIFGINVWWFNCWCEMHQPLHIFSHLVMLPGNIPVNQKHWKGYL